jgi:hypothetical protein
VEKQNKQDEEEKGTFSLLPHDNTAASTGMGAHMYHSVTDSKLQNGT